MNYKLERGILYDCLDTGLLIILSILAIIPVVVLSPILLLGYVAIKTGLRGWVESKVGSL